LPSAEVLMLMRTPTLVIVLAVCHLGLAKPHAPRSAASPSPRPQRFADFDGELIEASQQRPGNNAIVVLRHGVSPSLIHVRERFRPERLRSADAI
jgi:hypothetical protein